MTQTKEKPPEHGTEPGSTGTAVISIKDRIASRLAKVNESTAAPASSKISVKGSVFTLPDGKSSKGPLNCVVVDYINSNIFYEGAYVEGQFSQPTCNAIGSEIKLMAPAESVENKQSDTCATCPQNEFGSKGRGKACQNGVVLAILAEDFDDDSEVYTIRVSATGLKDWGKYVRELSELGVDPIQVITSLTFKEGLSYPSLKFRQLTGNDRLDEIDKFIPAADTLLKVG